MAEAWVETTPADIRDAAFGIEIPEGEEIDTQIARLIAKAAARLANAVPSLAARIASSELPIDVVSGVLEDMVVRVVSNPRGLRTMSIDDFQATIDSAVSSGRLYITPEELALLAPRSAARPRAIRMGIPSWRLPGA